MSSDTSGASRRPSPLLGLLAEALIALPGLGAIGLAYLEVGPWLWLVRLQLSLFGAYYPKYTFLAYFLLALAATALVYAGLSRAGLRGRPVVGWFLTMTLGWWLGLPNWLALILGLPLVGGLVLLGIGAYQMSEAITAGPRTEVRAEDLEAGYEPASRWLVVRGRPLLPQAITWTEGSRVKGRTVPVVSPAWTPGTPVAVLASYDSDAALPGSGEPAAFEGTARRGGIPGLTRLTVEKQNLRLTADAILLDVGSKPDGKQDNARSMLAIAALLVPLAVLACLLCAWVRRRWLLPSHAHE